MPRHLHLGPLLLLRRGAMQSAGEQFGVGGGVVLLPQPGICMQLPVLQPSR